ncbi:MAG TPA: diphthine synthase, partial [Thermoplasmata archaeon]|nr:diphthine synthase [Thermoplasmata archaeon]
TTVPFTTNEFRPTSPLEVIGENRERGLHTLVLLDLTEGGEFLDPREAMRYLLETARERGSDALTQETVVCIVSQVGSSDPKAISGRLHDLLRRDVGRPLHCIVVPGELHFMERDALIKLAGAPKDL